jgi:hypothetical protein
MLLATVFACLLGTMRITPQMLTHYGYFRWANGMAEITPEYLSAFERDRRFQQRFIGEPIEALRPLFPKLHSGAAYEPDSYRASSVRLFFSRYTGNRFEDYWLEGTQQQFGFCVLVVDGRIKDFFYVKG